MDVYFNKNNSVKIKWVQYFCIMFPVHRYVSFFFFIVFLFYVVLKVLKVHAK